MKQPNHFFYELPVQGLEGALIFLDVDGTLVPDGCGELSPEAVAKLRELEIHNRVVLCSNGTKPEARVLIKKQIGLEPINVGVRKPSRKILSRVPDRGERPLVVIGDQYLTDGLFALRIGARFIKIKRLNNPLDRAYVRTAYIIDDLLALIMAYVSLLRPRQWIKNLLVLAPVFFAGAVFDPDLFLRSLIAALLFCLISSAMYIFNDIHDRKEDQLHPLKQFRPVASGAVSLTGAWTMFAVLIVLWVLGLGLIPILAPVMLLYVVLNIFYTSKLKQIAVLDLILVAFFYVLRIVAGGVAAGTYISPWIILCVLFGALFMIIGKRRGEFERIDRRAVLSKYSREALDFMMATAASLAIITYGIWTIIGHTSTLLVYSTIFVVFALFRILNRIYTHPEQAESPELLVFRDPWIFASFILWILYVFMIFYLGTS